MHVTCYTKQQQYKTTKTVTKPLISRDISNSWYVYYGSNLCNSYIHVTNF